MHQMLSTELSDRPKNWDKVSANPITYRDCLRVAENMREADKIEIYATRWDNSPQMLTRDCLNTSAAFGWTIGKESPIVAIGAFPIWPNVWSVWMFATPRFPEVVLFTTKFVIKHMIKALLPICHRAECRSIEGHLSAHKWLEILGARREATLTDYGKDGQTFYVYRWSQYVF